jgi:hypothetical protein
MSRLKPAGVDDEHQSPKAKKKKYRQTTIKDSFMIPNNTLLSEDASDVS